MSCDNDSEIFSVRLPGPESVIMRKLEEKSGIPISDLLRAFVRIGLAERETYSVEGLLALGQFRRINDIKIK